MKVSLIIAVIASVICHAASAGAFTPPPESAIPKGPLGDSVRRGEAIFTATHKHAGPYVGNNLNCSDCHLDRGRKAGSIPMWGAWPLYPQFRTKNGKVNTMALRIQECFLYSMNGKKPPADSDVVTDLQSYFAWLATGAPTGMILPGGGYPVLPASAAAPDPKRGAPLFDKNCAACHGANGKGNEAAGIPPLWGPESFNAGAGMHEVEKAARFIRANMPLGQEGTLTPGQARDIAAYIDSKPRPADPEGQRRRISYPQEQVVYLRSWARLSVTIPAGTITALGIRFAVISSRTASVAVPVAVETMKATARLATSHTAKRAPCCVRPLNVLPLLNNFGSSGVALYGFAAAGDLIPSSARLPQSERDAPNFPHAASLKPNTAEKWRRMMTTDRSLPATP